MSVSTRRGVGRFGRRGISVLISLAMAAGCSTRGSASPSFAAVAPTRAGPAVAAETLDYDRFGTVRVYRGRGRPHDFILFVSGDGGWDASAAILAQRLADRGAMVAGFDLRHYRAELEKASESCVSPSPDFENLSHYLQSQLGLSKYLEPTLVGYRSGATLAYATLAEAPEGLFKGAVSIGFCPDLALKKPLCASAGLKSHPVLDANGAMRGMSFAPATQLPGKWIALQGDADTVCPIAATKRFVAGVPGAVLMSLPSVGHEYTVDASWMPQYAAAYGRMAAIRTEVKPSVLPAALADLPLTIVPARVGSRGEWFGVFLTGDGGWAGLDKGVAAELAKHDIPMIGWDSLKYFWSRRTPEGTSHDLDRVLRYYAHAWGKSHILLVGYSQGADTMPFMINRLPPATHALVGYTALLGISDNAVFEFHVATWLGKPTKGIPTAPELEHWTGSPYLCLYGETDGDAACAQLTGHDGTVLKLAGGHHFAGSYTEIADDILSRLPSVRPAVAVKP